MNASNRHTVRLPPLDVEKEKQKLRKERKTRTYKRSKSKSPVSSPSPAKLSIDGDEVPVDNLQLAREYFELRKLEKKKKMNPDSTLLKQTLRQKYRDIAGKIGKTRKKIYEMQEESEKMQREMKQNEREHVAMMSRKRRQIINILTQPIALNRTKSRIMTLLDEAILEEKGSYGGKQ